MCKVGAIGNAKSLGFSGPGAFIALGVRRADTTVNSAKLHVLVDAQLLLTGKKYVDMPQPIHGHAVLALIRHDGWLHPGHAAAAPASSRPLAHCVVPLACITQLRFMAIVHSV